MPLPHAGACHSGYTESLHILRIQLAQTEQMLVASLGGLFRLGEQGLCTIREGTGQRRVTRLTNDEVTIVGRGALLSMVKGFLPSALAAGLKRNIFQ